MMNRLVRLISTLLCLVFVVCSVSCSCNEEEDPQQDDPQIIVDEHNGMFSDNAKEENLFVIETENEDDIYLANNFTSSYKIVIPKTASSIIKKAAEELTYFIKEAAGVTLPTVTDEGITYDTTKKYISIGETSILKESGITYSFEELLYSGYKLNTRGSQIIIAGSTDTGNIYGVYGLLKFLIDFEAYAIDEVDFKPLTKLFVFDFKDYVHKPAIDVKHFSNHHNGDLANIYNLARMGLCSSAGAGYNLEGSYFGAGLNVHTTFTILPPGEYQPAHPNWYGTTGDGKATCICMSQDDLVEEFGRRLCYLIEMSPNSNYYNIGHQDNWQCCHCEKCQAVYDTYGQSQGASYIYAQFLNKLSVIVENWVAENQPERIGRVFIGGLAYFAYNTSPTYYNEETGVFTPIDDSVILRDNVFMQYCTHDSCMAHALNDPECDYNESHYRQFKGWASISKHMKIYSYSGLNDDYFIFYNDYNAIQKNMQLFQETAVDYLFYEGGRTGEGPFDSLRYYLFSKFSDNPNQDFDTLVRKFMAHYYKDAADLIYQFYRNLRDNYVVTAEALNQNICMGVYSYNPYMSIYKTDKRFWPYSFLSSSEEIFDKAYKVIAESKLSDEVKARMNLHIDYIEIPIRYRLIRNYSTYYPEDQLDSIKAKFIEDATSHDWTTNTIFDSKINFE